MDVVTSASSYAGIKKQEKNLSYRAGLTDPGSPVKKQLLERDYDDEARKSLGVNQNVVRSVDEQAQKSHDIIKGVVHSDDEDAQKSLDANEGVVHSSDEGAQKSLGVNEDVFHSGDEDAQKSRGVHENVAHSGDDDSQKSLGVNEDVVRSGDKDAQKSEDVTENVAHCSDEDAQKSLRVNQNVARPGDDAQKSLDVNEDVVHNGDKDAQKSLGVNEDVVHSGKTDAQKSPHVTENVFHSDDEDAQKSIGVHQHVAQSRDEEAQKSPRVTKNVVRSGDNAQTPLGVTEGVLRVGNERQNPPGGKDNLISCDKEHTLKLRDMEDDFIRDGEELAGESRRRNEDIVQDSKEQTRVPREVHEDERALGEDRNQKRLSLGGSSPRCSERKDALDGVDHNIVNEEDSDLDDLLDDDDDDLLRGEARLLAGLLRPQSEFSDDYESCDEDEDIEDNYDNDIALACKMDVDATTTSEKLIHLNGDERSSVEGEDMRLVREAVARGELGARDSDDDAEDDVEMSDIDQMDESSVMDMLLRARQRAEEKDADDEEMEEKLRGEELRAAVSKFITKFDLNEESRKLIRCQNDEVQRELIKFDPTDDEEVVDESGKRDINAPFQSFARDIIEVSRQLGQDRTDVSDFISKWHLNNESAQLLESLSAMIQEKVMNSFEPPRVASPRNSIDSVFQHSCRNTAMKIFCEQWKLDEQSKEKLYGAPPRVQLDMMASFNPKGYSRQPRCVNKLFTDFATNLMTKEKKSSRAPSKTLSRPKSTKTVSKMRRAFVEKWKLDAFSRVIFKAIPSHKAEEIMRDFGPRYRDRKPDQADRGEDVNAIFVSFVKSRDPHTMYEVTRGVRDGTIYVDRRFRKGPPSRLPSAPPSAPTINIKEALETDAFSVRSKRMLLQFCKKWNLDKDCLLHLQAAPSSVQAQVIEDFTPREDASNINKVFMSFLRSRRMDNQFIPNFVRKYDLDADSKQLLESLDVVTLRTTIRNFAPRDATRNYNPVFKSFTNGILQKHAESFKKTVEVRRLVTDFVKKWKLNGESTSLLKSYAPDAQLRLIMRFKPRDAARDASKLFIAYAKSRDEKPSSKAAPANRGVASKTSVGDRQDERGSAPSKKRPRELSFRRADRSVELRDGIRRRIDNSFHAMRDPPVRLNASRQADYNVLQRETRRHSNLFRHSAPVCRRQPARSNERYPAQGGGRVRMPNSANLSDVCYDKHDPSSTSRDADRAKNSRQYSCDGRHNREGESNVDRVYVKRDGGDASGTLMHKEDRIGSVQSYSMRPADGGGSKRCDDGCGDIRHGDVKWRNGKRDRDGNFRCDSADYRPRHVEDRQGGLKTDPSRGEGKKNGTSAKSAQVKVDDARRAFLKYWKLDHRADEFMSSKNSDIQWYIMDNFQPREENTLDRLSPLFMNYVKSTAVHWNSISQEVQAKQPPLGRAKPALRKKLPTAAWPADDDKRPAKYKQEWCGQAKEIDDGCLVAARKVARQELPEKLERPKRSERSPFRDERRRRSAQGPERTQRPASRDDDRRRLVQGSERTHHAASRDDDRRRPVQGTGRTQRAASRDENRKRPVQGPERTQLAASRDDDRRRPGPAQGSERTQRPASRDDDKRRPVQGPERTQQAASRNDDRRRPAKGSEHIQKTASRDEHRRRPVQSPERTQLAASRDNDRRWSVQHAERTQRAGSRDEHKKRQLQGPDCAEHPRSRDNNRRLPVQGPERTEGPRSRDEHRKLPGQGVKHPEPSASRDEDRRRPVQSPERTQRSTSRRRRPDKGSERSELHAE